MTLQKLTVGFILLLTPLLLSCGLFGKSKLRNEANEKAKQWWDSDVAKCGDSYYLRVGFIDVGAPSPDRDVLFQFKPTTYALNEETLTEATKLNGIEWAGQIIIHVNAYREYDYKLNRWAGWFDGEPEYHMRYQNKISAPILGTGLRKEKGVWIVGERSNPLTCSQIPAG